MSECTNEPGCFVNKGEYEVNPLCLQDSIHEYWFDNIQTEDCTTDQLTVWNAEKYNDPKYDTKCHANLNELYENVNTQKQNENLNNKRYSCVELWDKLRQVFELTDEQLNATASLKNTFPEDIFYQMPIDFNDDDCGENLVNFQLDGEYLFNSNGTTQSDKQVNNNNNLIVNEKVSIKNEKDNEVIIDESKVQPVVGKKTATITNSNGNDQNNNKAILQNINHTPTKTNSATKDIKENKKIDFKNDQIDNEDKNANNKTAIKKQNVKKIVKGRSSGKRVHKACCLPVESVIKNEESGYNLKYIYSYGEKYRGGIQSGHKNCVDFWIPIPRAKGWISESFINAQRKITTEQRRLKLELGRMQEENTQLNSIAEEKATKKKEKQQTKPRIVNQSVNNLINDGETKRIIKDNNMDSKHSAVPAFKLDKNNGVYTITMNRLTNDGRLDMGEDPVVFRLGAQMDAEIHSSCSNLNIKINPSAALCPKKTARDMYTSYDQFFQPTGKKKGEKNAVFVQN